MKPETPTAHVEEPPHTRDLILDAAERLFAQRGFSGVSMRDIVAETYLKNQASLYHHFGNKRQLYDAVLARALDHIIARLPRGEGAVTPDEVSRSIDILIDYLAAHPHLAPLIQRAVLDDAGSLESIATRLMTPLYQHGRQTLAAVGGIWSADELPHLASGLYHLIFGYFASVPLFDAVGMGDALSPVAVERQRRFLKAAVLRLFGLQPPREGSP